MLQQRGRELSLDDWLVLCLVREGPTYGLVIAGLLARDGRLGQVWHVTSHWSTVSCGQRRQLAPINGALASEMHTATGYDHVLAIWRHRSVSATLRFLDAQLAPVPAQRGGTAQS